MNKVELTGSPGKKIIRAVSSVVWQARRTKRTSMTSTLLNIGPLRASRTPVGAWRVTARVGSADVWFESDVSLEPAQEALATAFLFPAMSRGLDLHVESPVCAVWLANMERVRAIARKWWSFRGGAIHATGARSRSPSAGRALFYGGGVDSTFALYKEKATLSHLVHIEGFDVQLADVDRLERVKQNNLVMARECALAPVVVRSNLRAHPDFNVLSWDNAGGGALACVAHLLQQHCGTFLISGDGHLSEIDPAALAIHPTLTREWSSGSVKFVHQGEGISRHAKAGTIAKWPLAMQNLRVCWENRSRDMNCGICEKCLRTRIAFIAAGVTDSLVAFPDEPIIASLGLIKDLPPNLYLYYQEMFDDIKDPELRRAILELGTRVRARVSKKPLRYRLAGSWARLTSRG